jgi:pimeloyl-ACP methyl ester carboxylesterase
MKKIIKTVGHVLLFLIAMLVVFSVIFYRRDIPLDELKEKYSNQDSRFLPMMGMQVHYRDEGDSLDSLPLVLIHGTTSSLHTWDSLALLLKEQKRIIRFDLPGFGLTGPSPGHDYSFQYYEKFLDSFLINMRLSHCILAGNSLGAGIAWEYAVAHPEKVRKLILLDATGFPLDGSRTVLGLTLIRTPLLGGLARYVSPKFITRMALKEVYGDEHKVTDALVQRYFDLTLRPGNREALVERMKSGFDQDSSRIRLVSMPTLIIWGEKDRMVPLKNAYLFHQAIKGSSLEVLENTGHVPMEESPQRVAEIVKKFISP